MNEKRNETSLPKGAWITKNECHSCYSHIDIWRQLMAKIILSSISRIWQWWQTCSVVMHFNFINFENKLDKIHIFFVLYPISTVWTKSFLKNAYFVGVRCSVCQHVIHPSLTTSFKGKNYFHSGKLFAVFFSLEFFS